MPKAERKGAESRKRVKDDVDIDIRSERRDMLADDRVKRK